MATTYTLPGIKEQRAVTVNSRPMSGQHETNFLKRSMKCSECKVVSHPQCRERCPLPCTPNPIGCPLKIGEGCVYDVLADYAPDSSPSIPPLVISCVNEIEQRGLCEAGLYRLSGSYVQVKDLKEEFLLTNMVPVLSEVENINTVTGLLKDFLRNLKEPLLTFRLTQAFMDAAEVSDEENSFSLLYQSISDLPKANRDTLAFLVLHLQRVAESLETRMDIHNLALVFGPTIVGHAVPNPDLMTIMWDTNRQIKVMEHLLTMPITKKNSKIFFFFLR
uniref:Rac GTPase activating protein 1 n=1 Tax=Gouania willdenowi TaxID=441366 RepID=A0A8C5FYB2_GOUWI